MKRKPEWSQDTPRMQLATLVQCVQGNLLNAKEFSANPDKLFKSLARATSVLKDVQEILKEMPQGHWDIENLFDKVKIFLLDQAKDLNKDSGIQSIFLHPSGKDFILYGPMWTPYLSTLGASWGAEAQDKISPDCKVYINGSFSDYSVEDNFTKIWSL